jgi:hypothetical protein
MPALSREAHPNVPADISRIKKQAPVPRIFLTGPLTVQIFESVL